MKVYVGGHRYMLANSDVYTVFYVPITHDFPALNVALLNVKVHAL